MSHLKKTLGVAAAAVLLAAASVSAQSPDRSTKVTFSGPVSLPGITLPAGTYTFKLADAPTTRHVVQVSNADDTSLLATIVAVPAERNQPAGETVITFRETPANMPPAVRFWYYPGDTRGQEFAYPREQAMQLANATGEEVLAIDADLKNPDSIRSGEISRVSPASPAEQEARSASDAAPAPPAPPSPPAAPAPEPAERAEAPAQRESVPAPTAQAQRAPASATPDRQAVRTPGESAPAATTGRLPSTASELPLIGLVGLVALGGALIMRALRLSIATDAARTRR